MVINIKDRTGWLNLITTGSRPLQYTHTLIHTMTAFEVLSLDFGGESSPFQWTMPGSMKSSREANRLEDRKLWQL